MGRITPIIRIGTMMAVGATALWGANACNEHSVVMVDQNIVVEENIPLVGNKAEKLDILWVIDNSGSMCRNQQILREGIDGFIEILSEGSLDFNIGITTTHYPMTEWDDETGDWKKYSPEPIAEPGRLQSTPQPLPGFDPVCHSPVDEVGQPIFGQFDPIVESIQVAVDCTDNPGEWQHLVDNIDLEKLKCALPTDIYNCDTEYDINDFFPDPAAYREIPTIINSEDPRYRLPNGALDQERIAADFSCMSLVGTRGHGFEKGLAAAVKAVSPEMNAEGAPNHGFLREDARTAVIFVSDENDCSHDGTLDERSACLVPECTFQENLGEDGALIPIPKLRHDFLLNIGISKGIFEPGSNPSEAEVHDRMAKDVIAASIHGHHRLFTGDHMTSEQCHEYERDEGEPFSISPSCATPKGMAWSGHRYAQFISDFPVFFPDPRPAQNPNADFDPIDDIEGLICYDFAPVLEEIADMIRVDSAGCLADVYSCAGPQDTSCPTNPSTGEPGQCVRYPNYPSDQGAQFYCDSSIEVRLNLPEGEEDLSRLESTGYCIEGTIGSREFPTSCTISPEHYYWAGCGEGLNPYLTLEWNDDQWFQILDGLDVSARYARN